jgi:hypothetical protein
MLTGGSVLNLEKPDLIMGLKGLLRALSTSQLASARTLPQNILYHLLVNLPSGMPVQAAALLQKLENLIGKKHIFNFIQMTLLLVFFFWGEMKKKLVPVQERNRKGYNHLKPDRAL